MSNWPATKARRVLAALLRAGWVVKRQSGSHRTLSRADRQDFVFAFHEDDELGPRILSRIAKHTGLTLTTCSAQSWMPAQIAPLLTTPMKDVVGLLTAQFFDEQVLMTRRPHTFSLLA